MRFAGIDEAGYGPTLGPLAVCATAVDCPDQLQLDRALRAHGVSDSKTLHKAGTLAPLEGVALGAITWMTGKTPQTAADVFALCGETAADRSHPWQAGAEAMRLPVSSVHLTPWAMPDLIHPIGINGRLIHAGTYNAFITNSGNKADLELAQVIPLLRWAGGNGPSEMVVDRLGGRRYYATQLEAVWPQQSVAVVAEGPGASRYQAGPHSVSFLVGGESHWGLTALSSCIAKYARELHMLLFNRYWAGEIPGLKATAGYPEDARRFLAAIGPDRYEPLGANLIRGWPRF